MAMQSSHQCLFEPLFTQTALVLFFKSSCYFCVMLLTPIDQSLSHLDGAAACKAQHPAATVLDYTTLVSGYTQVARVCNQTSSSNGSSDLNEIFLVNMFSTEKEAGTIKKKSLRTFELICQQPVSSKLFSMELLQVSHL